VRAAAARSQSQNNLKQLGLATHNCNDSFGKIPPVFGCFPFDANNIGWGGPYQPSRFGTVLYFLTPFVEQQTIFNETITNSWYDTPSGMGRSDIVIKPYVAPGDPSAPADFRTWSGNVPRGGTSYAANWHVFRGGWNEDWQKGGVHSLNSIKDGLSNTIFWSERYMICGDPALPTGTGYVEHIWGEDGQNAGPVAQRYTNNVWFCPGFWASIPGGFSSTGDNPNQNPVGYPANYVTLPQAFPQVKDCDPTRLQTLSEAGLQVGLGDGSVKVISSNISQQTFARAIDPVDGLPLGTDW